MNTNRKWKEVKEAKLIHRYRSAVLASPNGEIADLMVCIVNSGSVHILSDKRTWLGASLNGRVSIKVHTVSHLRWASLGLDMADAFGHMQSYSELMTHDAFLTQNLLLPSEPELNKAMDEADEE